MQLIVGCLIVFAMMSTADCQRAVATDVRVRPLSLRDDIAKADLILLAYPIVQRDRRITEIRREPPLQALPAAEMEVKLHTLRVIKGPASIQDVSFRYFDGRAAILNGPPQGPSGGIGVVGLFFLRERDNASFRSVVDVFRPDIAADWIKTADAATCAQPASCISDLLLMVKEGDNYNRFSQALPGNVNVSESLVGYLKTLQLLVDLLRRPVANNVTMETCRQLSLWYSLELNKQCLTVLSQGHQEGEYQGRMEKRREKLLAGGLPWLEAQVQPKDKTDMLWYLQTLAMSADDGTRQEAERLLAALK